MLSLLGLIGIERLLANANVKWTAELFTGQLLNLSFPNGQQFLEVFPVFPSLTNSMVDAVVQTSKIVVGEMYLPILAYIKASVSLLFTSIYFELDPFPVDIVTVEMLAQHLQVCQPPPPPFLFYFIFILLLAHVTHKFKRLFAKMAIHLKW